MGFFQHKQRPADDDALEVSTVDAATQAADDTFREEMRQYGRQQYKQIIDEMAVGFKQDLETTLPQITSDLKDHMTKQLDATVARVNASITDQLNQRLTEHDRIVKDAQDMAVQSLNRNAQAVHEKYQQMSSILQQTVSGQEVQMISLFEEQKTRLHDSQEQQDALLSTLQQGAQVSQQQALAFSQSMQQVIDTQGKALEQALSESTARVDATKAAQEAALNTISHSAIALEEQSKQLSSSLEQAIAKQKDIMTAAFEENMAQVIEHYLLGAFGDQYDMKAQVPLIIQQMTDNKQAIMDDMKL